VPGALNPQPGQQRQRHDHQQDVPRRAVARDHRRRPEGHALRVRCRADSAGAGCHRVERERRRLGVRGPMDIWIAKETYLDRFYERYGTPIGDGWAIIDVGAEDCEGGGKQGGSAAGGGGSGAADLQDLVGARGAGGETELQRRGYNHVAGSKWSNGWHCVTVHTANGHYNSIVDTPMAKCH